MEKMNDEISLAIKNNLPAAVGEQLRKRLEDCERSERRYEEATLRVKILEDERVALKKALEQYANLEAREAAVEKLSLAVEDRERKLQMQLLEVSRLEANRRADGIFELARIAFGNKQLMSERVVESRSFPMACSNQGYTSQQTESRNVTRDVTTEG